MSPLRLEDLPKALRERIAAEVHVPPPPEHPSPCAGRRRGTSAAARWTCKGCGESFTKYAPAQRHSSAACNGHSRLECVLLTMTPERR